MKTFLIKFLTALLTFVIGVGLFLGYWNVWLTNQPQTEVEEVSLSPVPIQTTFCEIVDRKHALDGKLVTFEATAYVINGGTIMLNPDNCYFRGNTDLMFAKLNLESYSGKHAGLKSLLEGKDSKSREDFKEVDVRVTGTPRVVTDSVGYKMYSITPTDLEIISPFRKFTPKGAA